VPRSTPKLRISCGTAILAACFALSACETLGLGGGEPPAGPTGPPPAGSSISYTAVGASDALGIGSTVACLPYSDCPGGKGYVYVAANALRAQNYSVTLLNLGIPTAVISQRLQTLGQKYGRLLLGNFISDEMPFVQRGATLVTVFAGGNDVDVITAALARGEGGPNPTAFIDQQIAAFREDYSTLMDGIRSRSPSAQIVLFNVPNLAGLPFLAGASLSERQAAQRLSVGITTTVVNPLTAQGARVVDLMCEPRLYQTAQLSSDGFHPNDAGYAILAAEVVRATTSSAYAAPKGACAEMMVVPNL